VSGESEKPCFLFSGRLRAKTRPPMRHSYFCVRSGAVGERTPLARAKAAEANLHSMWRRRAEQNAKCRAESAGPGEGDGPLRVLSVGEACDRVPEPFSVLACAWQRGHFLLALHCGSCAAKRPTLIADAAKAANEATKRVRSALFPQDGEAPLPYKLLFLFVHDFPRPRQGLDGSAFLALSKHQKQAVFGLQSDGARMQGPVRLQVEVWHMDELQYDIAAPGMLQGIVPVQRKATHLEIRNDITHGKLRKLHVSDLPRAKGDDAMVRWLGLRAGDVLRSERPNGTVHYRVVQGESM